MNKILSRLVSASRFLHQYLADIQMPRPTPFSQPCANSTSPTQAVYPSRTVYRTFRTKSVRAEGTTEQQHVNTHRLARERHSSASRPFQTARELVQRRPKRQKLRTATSVTAKHYCAAPLSGALLVLKASTQFRLRVCEPLPLPSHLVISPIVVDEREQRSVYFL